MFDSDGHCSFSYFHSGTPAYCPPEWILNNEYLAVAATVWSLGVVLYEILSGNLPFYSEKEISAACVPLISGLSEGEKIRSITFLPVEQNSAKLL